MKYILTIISLLFSSLLCSQTKYCSEIEGELILNKKYLTISYDKEKKIPNYVGYYLTKDNLKKVVERETTFYDDKDIPVKYRAYSKNYSNSGYDRGHMSPAADWRMSKEAMHESFSMANICPQKPKLNRQYWESVEEIEREMINDYDTLYVISGQICCNESYIKNKVRVPTTFYKTIVGVKNDGTVTCKAWSFNNENTTQKPEKNTVRIKEIENVLQAVLYNGFWFSKTLHECILR